MRRRLLLAPAVLLTAALAAAPAAAAPDRPAATGRIALEYLGETELPNAAQFRGTTVGGLSGISWDRESGRYLLMSDDRSATDPARFYRAAITARKGTVSVRLTATRPLRQEDGATFPPTSTDGTVVAPDPEGIAVDPRRGGFLWSSEGERVLDPLTLADPVVRRATDGGRTTAVLPTAPQLHMNVQEVGPRRNQALEGLTMTPGGRWVWTGMEDPLHQDGPNPTPARGGLVRLTKHDAASGIPVAQVAYRLEPLFEPGPKGSTNGLSDLVALGGGRFLVVERAFTTRNAVRVFLADTAGATDVLGRDSLRSAPVRPVTKRLVLDLADVPGLPRLDNVEGITLGPRLPDGRRLLLLVSDDNFSDGQVTQFIAFAAKGLRPRSG